MNEEMRIAKISDVISDCCPDNMELLECAKLVVKAAVNSGIPEYELSLAISELYGED